MSTTFTIEDSDKQYSADDWKREGLKVGQTYKWRLLKTEATKSKAGKAMAVLTVAPTTESGAILKQFTQKIYLVLPVKSLGEKAYRFALGKYFAAVQSFAAPEFNAFSKIEVSAEGTKYFGLNGVELTERNERTEAINAAKSRMLDIRETVLDFLEPGQEAYAPFKPAREGQDYPEVGYFTQGVDVDAVMPYVETVAEMIG